MWNNADLPVTRCHGPKQWNHRQQSGPYNGWAVSRWRLTAKDLFNPRSANMGFVMDRVARQHVSHYFGLPVSVIIPPMLYISSYIYHRRYINLANDSDVKTRLKKCVETSWHTFSRNINRASRHTLINTNTIHYCALVGANKFVTQRCLPVRTVPNSEVKSTPVCLILNLYTANVEYMVSC
jgi:hypothetical protein